MTTNDTGPAATAAAEPAELSGDWIHAEILGGYITAAARFEELGEGRHAEIVRQLGHAYTAQLAQFRHVLAILSRTDPAAAVFAGPLPWPADAHAAAGDSA